MPPMGRRLVIRATTAAPAEKHPYRPFVGERPSRCRPKRTLRTGHLDANALQVLLRAMVRKS